MLTLLFHAYVVACKKNMVLALFKEHLVAQAEENQERHLLSLGDQIKSLEVDFLFQRKKCDTKLLNCNFGFEL